MNNCIGKWLDWQDAKAITRRAKIIDLAGHGVTSDVYRAEEQDAAPGRFWAVKIPHPKDPSAPQDPRVFVDELVVVERLRERYARESAPPPLPQLYRADLEGAPVLVMEYCDSGRQVMAVRAREADFPVTRFREFALGAVQLFEWLHELGFVTSDIKDENFYWMEDQRLLVLDWNRCTRLSDDDRSAESRIREAYRLLTSVLYTVYTNQNPPNPLPSSPDVSWAEACPRTLRRILLQSRSGVGISPQILRDESTWLVDLESWRRGGQIDRVLREGEALKQDDAPETLAVSRLPRIQDVISVLDQNSLDEPEKARLEALRMWVDNLSRDVTARFQVCELAVRADLDKFDFAQAVERCNNIAEEPTLPTSCLWRLARLSTAAQCLHFLYESRRLTRTQTREARAIAALLVDNKLDVDSYDLSALELEARQSVSALSELLKEAEHLADVFPTASSPQERLDIGQKVSSLLERSQANLPSVAHRAIERQLPAWDIMLLRQEVVCAEAAQRARDQENALVQELVAALGSADYAALSRTLLRIDVEPSGAGTALRRSKSALEYLSEQAWPQAVERLLALPADDAIREAGLRRVHDEISRWLTGMEGRVLFGSDILTFQQLQSSLSALGIYLPLELQNRLNVTQDCLSKGMPPSREDLESCLVHRVEPFRDSSDSTALSVYRQLQHALLRDEYDKLRQLQQEREQLSVDLELLVDDPKVQQDIKHALDRYAIAKQQVARALIETRTELERRSGELAAMTQETETRGDELQRELDAARVSHDRLTKLSLEATQSSAQLQAEQLSLTALIGQLDGSLEQLPQRLAPLIAPGSSFELLIGAGVALAAHGEFGSASSLLGHAASSRVLLHADQAAVKALNVWRDQFSELATGSWRAKTYSDWFAALRQRDVEFSQTCSNSLRDDAGKPLYEWLLQRHRELAKRSAASADLYQLLIAGKIRELRIELQRFRQIPSNAADVAAWDRWIEQYELAQNLAALQREHGGRIDRVHMDLLKATIPSDIWKAAETHSR